VSNEEIELGLKPKHAEGDFFGERSVAGGEITE
jgi:hypothetical protein